MLINTEKLHKDIDTDITFKTKHTYKIQLRNANKLELRPPRINYAKKKFNLRKCKNLRRTTKYYKRN